MKKQWIFATLIAATSFAAPNQDGEEISAAEEGVGREVVELIKTLMRKENEGGIMRRDAHAKAHGCMDSLFQRLWQICQ